MYVYVGCKVNTFLQFTDGALKNIIKYLNCIASINKKYKHIFKVLYWPILRKIKKNLCKKNVENQVGHKT